MMTADQNEKKGTEEANPSTDSCFDQESMLLNSCQGQPATNPFFTSMAELSIQIFDLFRLLLNHHITNTAVSIYFCLVF